VPGVHSSRGCLPCTLRFQGLITLLAAFSSAVLGIHLSGPSVPGVLPFRVLFPLPSRTPSRGLCSLALSPSASGHDRGTVRTSEPLSRQRACLALPAFTQTTESLLSWGSASLRLHSSDPADRRRLLFCTLGPCLATPTRCSRVFLSKARLNFKKKSANPSDVSASSAFQSVWHFRQRGLMISPNETRCITTLSPSFFASPKGAC